MFKLFIDIAAGALSGATGGKIDLGRAVTQAVSKAAHNPDTTLKRQGCSCGC